MFSKFSIMFVGNVDAIDNVGLKGTPANDRFLSNDDLASVFDKSVALAQAGDRLGYDTIWFAEHHFQREGYEVIPNILQLAVHLAHLTERIKIGCAFNVASMWHPLRMAEDYATADILTKGRVRLGVGRGYQAREVETFGSPLFDQDANRELFEEQVDVMMKAFNEESFSHHGKHYTIPPAVPYRGYELEEITLVPRPINYPVECWQPIVSGSQRQLDFMAKHGIKGVIGGGAATLANAERVATAYQAALARAGRETQLGEDMILGYYMHMAEDREKAVEESKVYYEEQIKWFGRFGFIPGLSEEQVDTLDDPTRSPFAGLPTSRDVIDSGGWLAGNGEQVTQQLKAMEAAFPGTEHINVQSAVGTNVDWQIEQLEWFARDVMPNFS